MAPSVLERFASREPWTQSLSFVGGLQDRGWACLVAGASFLVIQSRPEGAFARMQRAQVIDVRQIELLCSRMPLAELIVEPGPSGVLIAHDGSRHRWDWNTPPDRFPKAPELGWRPNPRPVAHTRTMVVDLAPDLDQVISAFSSIARRNVRAAASADVEYATLAFDALTPNLEAELEELNRDFLAAHAGLEDEWLLRRSVATHFGPRGFLVSAHHDGRLIGAVYLLVHDRVAHYFAAQTRDPATALRVPTGLVRECCALAKEVGCDLFDFVGVFDERYPQRHRSWKGFTTFKSRFGGVPLELHPGFLVPLVSAA